MKRLAWLLVLCGCPQKGGGTNPVPPQPGVGCPPASGVYLASYVRSEGNEGHTGWLLPLFDAKSDQAGPGYAQIDAATASARGVPAPPPTIWLMQQNGPCRATIGSYYAASIEGGTPNTAYGVELDGCPAAGEQQDEAIALASEQSPSECQLLAPKPVAMRMGQMDAQKHWQRPTKESPIPPQLAGVIPPHDCRPPTCETLWSFAQVDVGDKPVAWAGAVNWLQIPPNAPPETQCQWKAEAFSGFFVAGPDGKAVKVTEGQEHPMLLTATLADRAGAKVLVAETGAPGEYAMYDLVAGAAKLGRHLVWLMLKPEAYAVDERLGPECDQR